MLKRGSKLRYALVLSLPAFAMLGGCGSSSPTAPSPAAVATTTSTSTTTATPTPTPVPGAPARTTLSLNAPADQSVYSSSLTLLAPSQTFSVDFKLDRINSNPTAQFKYAIEFWFTRTADPTVADAASDGAVLSLFQAQDNTWNVWVRTPGEAYRSTGVQVQVAVGNTRTLRVLRTPDGAIGFSLDGASLTALPAYKESAYVSARLVGTSATFTFVQGATSTSVGSSPF